MKVITKINLSNGKHTHTHTCTHMYRVCTLFCYEAMAEYVELTQTSRNLCKVNSEHTLYPHRTGLSVCPPLIAAGYLAKLN